MPKRSNYKARFYLYLMLFSALLIPYTVALAKGPPDKVTITGPGLKAPVEITDAETLQAFSFFQFEDSEHAIASPNHPGYGYVVTRFVRESEGDYLAWDRLSFHPNPSGSGGLVHYEGLLGEGMSSEFDGGWYLASDAGDAAVREILIREGVLEDDLNTAQPIALLGGAGLIFGLWAVASLMNPPAKSGEGSASE